MRRPALPVGMLTVLLLMPVVQACTPAARPGSLPPTLSLEDHGGAQIAMQDGLPVPTFDPQARRTITLDGPWRVQLASLDSDLSLTDRSTSLAPITAEAAGREGPDFDDSGWKVMDVPGAVNPPPRDRPENGAWYRRSFFVPATWTGLAATLKAEAINYLADVWVNGSHVGYHEGGYTPFALDLSALLVPGSLNTIAIRVDNPKWGTRNDIVPWGLTDWWNYGGITRSIRIEATPALNVVRADVTPHLDGMDVGVVVSRARSVIGQAGASASPTASATATESGSLPGAPPSGGSLATAAATLRVDVLPAQVTAANLASAVAETLVAPGAAPLTTQVLELAALAPGDVRRVDLSFLIGEPDLWSPARPALYVLRAGVDADGATDAVSTSFGLRRITVDEGAPRLLLNGVPTMFSGVGLHDERLDTVPAPVPRDVEAHRITDVRQVMDQLSHAREVNADLIRTGHAPANPLLLRLADRMGFGVWEEIPLYHYTPLTYGIAMDRGIPQQMLAEMDLRDMNRPSVLFHGLSNESTGAGDRTSALRTLRDLDRSVDGTRLTGQAAYGSMPADATQAPLDVAGYTFYYGVFYGTDAAEDTGRALGRAHDAFPRKPILALEFGRWVDDIRGAQQAQVFERTYPVLAARSGVRAGGYVGAAVWWTLEDFTTMSPGIALERFGLFRPDGTPRPAADVAGRLFAATAGEGAGQGIESDVGRIQVVTPAVGGELRALGLVGYALLVSIGSMALVLLLLVWRGGRAAAPRRGGAR
jgi:beta-glucuronidase